MDTELFHVFFVPPPMASGPAVAPETAQLTTGFLAQWRHDHVIGTCRLQYTAPQIVLTQTGQDSPALAPILAELVPAPQPHTARDRVIETVGRHLFIALFGASERLGLLWSRFLAEIDQRHATGRLVFHFEPDANNVYLVALLMALPWEALWDGDHPLCARQGACVEIVRCYRRHDQPAPMPASSHEPFREGFARIVALAPNQGMDYQLREQEWHARPRQAYELGGLLWCDLVTLDAPLAPAMVAEAIQRYQPDVLHYFGHGYLLDRDFAFMLDKTTHVGAELYTALAVQYAVADAAPRLLVSFACDSGSMLRQVPVSPEQADLLLKRPLVHMLAEHLPAMLVMQTLIDAIMAARASDLFYRQLARGVSVPAAVASMRRDLYVQGLNAPTGPAGRTQAWWIPALYLRDPHDGPDLQIYDPDRRRMYWQLAPGPHRAEMFDQQDGFLNQVLAAAQRPDLRVVEITGQRGGGKTALLRQLIERLQQDAPAWIAFQSRRLFDQRRLVDGAPPPAGAADSAQLYLQTIQREIVASIEQGSDKPIQLTHAHTRYASVVTDVALAAQSRYILIDDGDLLTAEHWAQLLPEGLAPGLRFITTLDPAREPLVPGNVVRMALPELTEDQRELSARRIYKAYEQRSPDVAGKPEYRLLESLIFGTGVPLHRESMWVVLKHSLPHLEHRQLLAYLDVLVNLHLLHVVDDLYRLRHASVVDLWRASHGLEYKELLPVIARWRDSHKSPHDYPADLLRILAGQPYHMQIEPIADEDEERRNGTAYLRWFQLAQAYHRHGLAAEFKSLVQRWRAHHRQCAYHRLDQLVLEYLVEAVTRAADSHNYLENSFYMWVAYEQLSESVVTRLAQAGAQGGPGLLQWILEQAEGLDVAGVITRLRSIELPDRHAIMARAVIPLLLHVHEPALPEVLTACEALLDAHARCDIAVHVVTMRKQACAPALIARMRGWLDTLLPARPADALRLFVTLLPWLTAEERRAYAIGLQASRLAAPAGNPADAAALADALLLAYCLDDRAAVDLLLPAAGPADATLVDLVWQALARPGDDATLQELWNDAETRAASEVQPASWRLRVLAIYMRCRTALGTPVHVTSTLQKQVRELRDAASTARDVLVVVMLAPIYENGRAITNAIENVVRCDPDMATCRWLPLLDGSPALLAHWCDVHTRVTQPSELPPELETLQNNIHAALSELPSDVRPLLQKLYRQAPVPPNDMARALDNWRETAGNEIQRIFANSFFP